MSGWLQAQLKVAEGLLEGFDKTVSSLGRSAQETEGELGPHLHQHSPGNCMACITSDFAYIASS